MKNVYTTLSGRSKQQSLLGRLETEIGR